MTIISLKLPDDLAKRLNTLARQRRLSKSALIRQAIQAYVGNGAVLKPRKGSFLDVAGDLVGSVRGGPGDLATNPKHMEGFGK